jgi:hypothetical protein
MGSPGRDAGEKQKSRLPVLTEAGSFPRVRSKSYKYLPHERERERERERESKNRAKSGLFSKKRLFFFPGLSTMEIYSNRRPGMSIE